MNTFPATPPVNRKELFARVSEIIQHGSLGMNTKEKAVSDKAYFVHAEPEKPKKHWWNIVLWGKRKCDMTQEEKTEHRLNCLSLALFLALIFRLFR